MHLIALGTFLTKSSRTVASKAFKSSVINVLSLRLRSTNQFDEIFAKMSLDQESMTSNKSLHFKLDLKAFRGLSSSPLSFPSGFCVKLQITSRLKHETFQTIFFSFHNFYYRIVIQIVNMT